MMSEIFKYSPQANRRADHGQTDRQQWSNGIPSNKKGPKCLILYKRHTPCVKSNYCLYFDGTLGDLIYFCCSSKSYCSVLGIQIVKKIGSDSDDKD